MKIIVSLILMIFSSNIFSIEIEGSYEYRVQVKKCLNLLSEKARDEYEFIESNIGLISQNERSGMRAWENPPRYEMSNKTAFHSLTWCAGTIAHDAYHSYLYKKFLPESGGRPPYEKWAGVSSEIQATDYQIKVMKKIGASDVEINYLKSLDGTYGDVNRDGKLDESDYKLRNW